jgi:hypothetical protein
VKRPRAGATRGEREAGATILDPEEGKPRESIPCVTSAEAHPVHAFEPMWAPGSTAVVLTTGRDTLEILCTGSKKKVLIPSPPVKRRESLGCLVVYKEPYVGRDRVAASFESRAIKVFDAETGERVRTLLGLDGHVDSIRSMVTYETLAGPCRLASCGDRDGVKVSAGWWDTGAVGVEV